MPHHPPNDLSESQARRASVLRSALGPLTPLLDDPRIVEMMLNADGVVCGRSVGEGLLRTSVIMEPRPRPRRRTAFAAEAHAPLHPSPRFGPFLTTSWRYKFGREEVEASGLFWSLATAWRSTRTGACWRAKWSRIPAAASWSARGGSATASRTRRASRRPCVLAYRLTGGRGPASANAAVLDVCLAPASPRSSSPRGAPSGASPSPHARPLRVPLDVPSPESVRGAHAGHGPPPHSGRQKRS
jgi:hypothetical protein